MYIQLLIKSLLGYLEKDGYLTAKSSKVQPFDLKMRESGSDWPTRAKSMIGMKRMKHLHQSVEYCLSNEIEGDFIETGVWRGGACILIQGIIAYRGKEREKSVYVADSFKGLPVPTMKGDIDLTMYNGVLGVDIDTVKQNFKDYDLLLDNVHFVKGYFENTMPPMKGNHKWALIRLDGDMYSSTKVVLDSLYEDLSDGGVVIVDDYHSIEHCKRAVDDFWRENGINGHIHKIDDDSVYWIKQS